MLKWLLLHMCLSAAALAQTSVLIVSATVPTGIAKEGVRLTVFLDGAVAEIPCPVFEGPSTVGLTQFRCRVEQGMHSAMFRLSMPGYKPYTVNLANLKVEDGAGDILLGVLRPATTDESRIDNVVFTRADNGLSRFQITVNNLAHKQMLITGITMQGNGKCASSKAFGAVENHRFIRFKISGRLLLTSAEPGKTAIGGMIADSSDHPNFPARLTGSAVLNSCGVCALSVSAPMNFTIPAQDFFEIELLVPPDRKLHPFKTSCDHRPGKQGSIPSAVATSDVFTSLDQLRFTLLTSDKDQPEIKSYFPSR